MSIHSEAKLTSERTETYSKYFDLKRIEKCTVIIRCEAPLESGRRIVNIEVIQTDIQKEIIFHTKIFVSYSIIIESII